MVCESCGRATKADARFCGGCGIPFAPRCPACGAEREPDARFCEGCGATLSPRPADVGGSRKVVTIVFADLAGSTALHERLDAESTRAFMDRYYRAMQGAVEAHGGTVTQLLGDGVKAVFGAPRVAEDDALRAVRAAVDMQRAFRALAAEQSSVVGEVGLRVAVHTGEVVAKDETEIIGDPVNVAARLQQEAHEGDVVIGESTQRLVSQLVTLRPFGTFALKGRAEPVSAWRVVSLERPAGAPAVAFVGREDELRRLMAVHEAAVAGPGARLAVILGSPGLGKSRLLAELGRRLGDRATLLVARCDATGGATFAPVAEALRMALRIEDATPADALRAAIAAAIPGEEAERARIAEGVAALLAGRPASPEETFFVVRRLLAALAARRPVVLAVDDLQWAEPLLLDLVEHLVQWSPDVPLLVLALARPELREARSSLATPGGLVTDVVTLAGLEAGAATRLAASVVGAAELPAAIAGRVLATSEGNPLFVGELVRMLVQDGVLRREGEGWTAGVELAALEMPPTIHALLAARIERLRPEERSVLELAAVVGRQFSRSAVAQLLPPEIPDLDARLEALRRSELIEPDTGWLLGEPVLRFHHVLIRDAAYRRLLKNTRAELHERFAGWLEGRVGEAVEHDETIGWHLEQAHQHLRELGPIDAHGRALGERASQRLAAAGRRALARDDVPVAASLLARALDRLDTADPARADLALDCCEALLAAGEVGAAAGAIEELGRFAGGSARLRAWHTCFAGELTALTDPQALRATADAVAAAAGELAAAGDAGGEAKAHSVHANALSRLGQVGAAEAALDRALAAARRAHDRRRANAVLAGAPQAALWGPSPVTRASGRCLDVVRVLRITQGAPAVEAVALRCQGVLEALRGRTEAARRMIDSSRRMVEELGLTQGLLETEVSAGLVELIEGDDAAAEKSLRTAYEGFRAHGLGIDAARAAGLLGRTLLPQGRAAEAEALSHESEALAGDDLQAAITWRRVRAEALALRGEHASAVEFARAAVEIAAATDALLHHADARFALAAALHAAGRSAEADAEERRGIELWETKGATLLAERSRAAARAEPGARAPAESAEPPRATRCHVRANAATAYAVRLDSAFVARDVDGFPGLLSDDYEMLDHPSGVAYDREAALSSHRALLRTRHPTHRHEPLATLGDSLALCRLSVSASGIARGDLDVGAFERPRVNLIEVDARGRARREESFAPDQLGHAIARLYERYAELLPEGPERTRAAGVARVVAGMENPLAYSDGWASAVAPDIEFADRRILGIATVHGADALLESVQALRELSDDFAHRIDGILAARPDGYLVLWTNTGTDRASGGAYERCYLLLSLVGLDGRLTRMEQFDPDSIDEALARFDELAAPPAPICRRVRANAATANLVHLDAAIADRDAGALPALFRDDFEIEDRTTGGVFGREGVLAVWRTLLSLETGTCRHEPLATLGDALALSRQSVSASGFALGEAQVGAYEEAALFAGVAFDVGPFEVEKINLVEVDAQGRRRRTEVFATDRLGDAVARLYERYAELLPEGPERTRAAATARSVAALVREPPDRWPFAPDVEATDARTVGFGSLRGADAVVRAIRALTELMEKSTWHCDDVLDLRSDALLVRWRQSGTDRAGGEFERRVCHLWIFGSDGLAPCWEQFDAEQDAAALARFDALAAAPPAPRPVRRRVLANAATANLDRLNRAVSARDLDALASLLSQGLRSLSHTTGVELDRPAILDWWRLFFTDEDTTFRLEPLATLGGSLALCRQRWSGRASGGSSFDVGAFEMEMWFVYEVDAEGRATWVEAFGADHLGDAVARLYARHAELLPEGPAQSRAVATARTVAALLGPSPNRDERLRDPAASLFAPDAEAVDHRTVGFGLLRGADAVLRAIRALHQLSEGVADRFEDLLALRSDALLVRWATAGSIRASGGAFQQDLCQLFVFGAEGLIARWEQFDGEQDAEALARFDALGAEPGPIRRRVRPNAVTANAARLDAAMAAGDADALPALVADGALVVEHTTGATYDAAGTLASRRALLRARNLVFRHEPLATLGDSLALLRLSISASGVAGRQFDVGAYEQEVIVLDECDAHGRSRRSELFAADRLGDALARLYERHAELLPEGLARTRSAATARSFPPLVMAGTWERDRHRAAVARDFELDDRRTVGVGSVRGVEAFLRSVDALVALSEGFAMRIDDVLALRSDALLALVTASGTDRTSGGSFERPYLWLVVFGSDGLAVRIEQFDVGHEDEALARFDALTAAPSAPRAVPRRVRANAATAQVAHLDAAVGARDAGALAMLLTEDAEVIDHTTGATYGRSGTLDHYRRQFRSRDLTYRTEPLATVGDSLALCRLSVSGSGAAGPTYDVGAFEVDLVNLVEVGARGKRRRLEIFATHHLGDAIARLYERYAELLPEGSQRARAAATARTVAALFGPPERWPLAPDAEAVDRRTVGFGSLHGADAVLHSIRALMELSGEFDNRVDDVLDLRADALVVRWTTSGTIRASGGAYERSLCQLWVFGADGQVTRWEQFDAEQDAEAVARFDALAAEAKSARSVCRRVRPNAATAHNARLERAIASRDGDLLPALVADRCEVVDHVTGVTYGREGILATFRAPLRARGATLRLESLATLGEALELCRSSLSASGYAGATMDVGPYERETISLVEVDAQGRRARNEVFAPDRLGDAVARLYERRAELLPEGPERARAAATARSAAAVGLGAFEPDRYLSGCAPDIEVVDHRTLGTWSSRGAQALLRNLRSWVDLADDIANRVDDVLGLSADALLARWTHLGTDRASGGAYERPFLMLWIFRADGLQSRWEIFDPDRGAEALARFDDLVAGEAQRPADAFANAASRRWGAVLEAWRQRQAQRFEALHPLPLRYRDHRRLLQLELDRVGFLAFTLPLLAMQSATATWALLATRGERLALVRYTTEVAQDAVGPSAIDSLMLIETDAGGEIVAYERWDLENEAAAYAELDARYVAGEAARFVAVAGGASAFAAAVAARDWDTLAALLAPDLVVNDHRKLGWETLQGPALLVDSWKVLVELAPDVRLRADHFTASDHGSLAVLTLSGTHEGGAFEDLRVVVHEYDGDGGIRRHDIYGTDQLDAARARFEAIGPSREAVPRDPLAALLKPNGATAATDRLQTAVAARDWAALRALVAEGATFEDRRRHVLVSGDVDWWLRDLANIVEITGQALRFERTLVATAGDRISLERVLVVHGMPGGRIEVEALWLAEVDEAGRIMAGIAFDVEDWRTANREGRGRWLAHDVTAAAVMGPIIELSEALSDDDRARARTVLADDLVLHDHRLVGEGRVDGADAYLDNVAVLRKLVTDVQTVPWFPVVVGGHGLVGVTRVAGVLPDGGAFDSYILNVVTVSRGCVTRIEAFEVEQADAALARFAELRPDPLRIPPNAATRARDRQQEAREAGDWDGLARLCAPAMPFDDRRRGIRLTGDRETYLANQRIIANARASRTLLATAGDHLALERVLWRGAGEDATFEIEILQLWEVDADGCLVALIVFDPDDRRAASRELFERDARSGTVPAAVHELRRAFLDRDLERCRAATPSDFVFHDHRRSGPGRVEGADAWTAWNAALLEEAADVITEPLYYVASEEHGSLAMAHTFGRLAGGGEFESVFVSLWHYRDGRPVALERFEPEDLELARARFEELRPASA